MECPPEPPEVPASDLTARERRIAPMVAQGWSNDVIARTLELPTETVELYRGSIYRKLGTDDHLLLAQWLIHQHLID